MKNYPALLLLICFYSGISAQTQNPQKSKLEVLEKIHWMIERSEINKVRPEFQKICNENHISSLVHKLKDGTYYGSTPEDDFGYRHEVTFEMKNGTMLSIDYDEIHRDGHSKRHHGEYCKRMLQSGTTPAIAYPKYEHEMLGKQDFNSIDAVSGATYSLFRFKLAILYAILNSQQI